MLILFVAELRGSYFAHVAGAVLVAVVAACLDNVARHVGEGAPAWVLLEAFADRVEVSVRDEGAGISDGRLAEAVAQGRLGISESIRGRIADLGGMPPGLTPDGGTSPEAFEGFIRSEIAKWNEVVRRSGATVE